MNVQRVYAVKTISVVLGMAIVAVPAQAAESGRYVWNAAGIALYEEPDYGSAKLAHLRYGTALRVLERTKVAAQFKYANPATGGISFTHDGPKRLDEPAGIISGHWIKVSAGEREGYVTDPLTSSLPPLKCKFKFSSAGTDERECESPELYSTRVFGKLAGKQWTTSEEVEGYGPVSVHYSRLKFKRGVQIDAVEHDLWSKHQWRLPGHGYKDGILVARLIHELVPSSDIIALKPNVQVDYRLAEGRSVYVYVRNNALIIDSGWAE